MLNILTKNTTATHLNIATRSRYGPVVTKKVKCTSINKINSKIDLIKLDVEGLESELLKKINFKKSFSDFILEVHNKKNARDIFKRLSNFSNIAMYKLKNSKLKIIHNFKDMPSFTKDGSLFITKSNFKI